MAVKSGATSLMRKDMLACSIDDIGLASIVQGTLLLASVSVVGSSADVAANDEYIAAEPEELKVVGGDILIDAALVQRAIVNAKDIQLWPDGVVPYTLDPELSIAEVISIQDAIQHWNNASGISLKPVDMLTGNFQPVTDIVRFVPGDVCASWVGRRGGEQSLWVAPNCNAGSVMHEIGHALGLEHEHTRPDRGNHIDIYWDNIDPGKRHNFDVAPVDSQMLGPYDYESIMHYGPTTFSINGQATIVPKDRSVSGMGQRVAPSQGDLNGIAELYGSDLSVLAQQFEDADGSDLAVHVTNESAQGAHDIELLVIAESSTILRAEPDEHWSCILRHTAQMHCNLNRLPANGTTVLRLNAIGVKAEGKISVSVTSKTPDKDPTNNVIKAVTDDPITPPDETPVAVESVPVQHDAVGKVILGGSVSPWYFGILLLLINKQSGRWAKLISSVQRRGLRRR